MKRRSSSRSSRPPRRSSQRRRSGDAQRSLGPLLRLALPVLATALTLGSLLINLMSGGSTVSWSLTGVSVLVCAGAWWTHFAARSAEAGRRRDSDRSASPPGDVSDREYEAAQVGGPDHDGPEYGETFDHYDGPGREYEAAHVGGPDHDGRGGGPEYGETFDRGGDPGRGYVDDDRTAAPSGYGADATAAFGSIPAPPYGTAQTSVFDTGDTGYRPGPDNTPDHGTGGFSGYRTDHDTAQTSAFDTGYRPGPGHNFGAHNTPGPGAGYYPGYGGPVRDEDGSRSRGWGYRLGDDDPEAYPPPPPEHH